MEKRSIVKGKTVKQVRKLNLSGQGLKEIPSYVFEYTNLTKLILSHNFISKIPQEISRLKKLEVLDLTYNKISSLAAPVCKLPKLRVLALGHNQLKKFPKQLVGSSIKQLIADHNQIIELDSYVLDGLSKIVISYNPIRGQIIDHKLSNLSFLDIRKTNLEPPNMMFLPEDCRTYFQLTVSHVEMEYDDSQIMNSAFNDNQETRDKILFISHSSKDKAIIVKFVDQILRLGIGVPSSCIRCTSIEENGIQNGAKMRDWIHQQIKDCRLSFLMISPNYKDSEICLNEMGAIWALEKDVRIFLLPGVDYNTFGWLEEIRQAGKIVDESALDLLRDDLTELYERTNSTADWGRHRREFLDYCKSITQYDNTGKEKSSNPEITNNIYLRCITQVFDYLDYHNYSGWSELVINGGSPRMANNVYDGLEDLITYLDSRASYHGYELLDKLLVRLSLLVYDFLSVFGIYCDEKNDICYIRPFYKEMRYNPNYDNDLEDYNAYVGLIRNMVFELTRLCNAILREARNLSIDFMSDFGIFTIDGFLHQGTTIIKFEYEEGESYSGLRDFVDTAMTRKYHIKYSKERVTKILGKLVEK